MGTNESEAVAAFFATHEAAIVALTLAVQQEIGGHYTAVDPDQQQAVAVGNVRNFAESVVSGQIDHAGIAAMLATQPDPRVVAAIVRMVELQEPRFAQFVAGALPADPALATEIQRRARNVATRFRMALASASLSRLAEQVPRPAPAPPRARTDDAPA